MVSLRREVTVGDNALKVRRKDERDIIKVPIALAMNYFNLKIVLTFIKGACNAAFDGLMVGNPIIFKKFHSVPLVNHPSLVLKECFPSFLNTLPSSGAYPFFGLRVGLFTILIVKSFYPKGLGVIVYPPRETSIHNFVS